MVGTPGSGGTALSVSLGAKWLSISSGDASSSLIYAPMTLLADLPLGAAKVVIKGGMMAIIASGGGSSEVLMQPLVGIGARVKLGGMTLMPEVNYMHGGSGTVSDANSSATVGGGLAAVGLGFAF